MPEEARVLRLSEMLAGQKGPPARRLIHAVVCVALRLFFRRIETSGEGRVPRGGALVFVLNHPNGLVDPALVFCALPRRISFLAKSTLFRLPVVGRLVRVLESLPVYRRVDDGEDVTRNRRTFEACHALLRRGRCIALFPEGVSHDAPHLLPVKTGAARIALGAASFDTVAGVNESDADIHAQTLDLKIVPVGLYYTSKTSFRSEALLRFGEALPVPTVRLGDDGEPPRDEVKRLSERIEEGLRAVTLNVADDEELGVATKAGQLFSSLYEGINIEQSLAARFDFLRRFSAWGRPDHARAPGRVERLRAAIVEYEAELRRVGLAPENLSLSSHPAWFVFRHFIFRGALLLVLSPLALAGALLHLPAYAAATLFARLFPKHGADASGPTVKILVATALVPLTWLVVATAAYFLWGLRAALVALPASVVCGYVAMRSLEELYDMRGWFKAALMLLRRRQLFLRLLLERRTLHNEIKELGDAAADERTAMFE